VSLAISQRAGLVITRNVPGKSKDNKSVGL